jgi:hypothetical protein
MGNGLTFTGTLQIQLLFSPHRVGFLLAPSGGSVSMSFSIPGQLIQDTATIDGLPSSVPPSLTSQFNFHGLVPLRGYLSTYPFTFDGTLQTATTLLNLDGDGIGTLRLVSSGTGSVVLGVFVAGWTLDFAAIPDLPRSCSLFQASGHWMVAEEDIYHLIRR